MSFNYEPDLEVEGNFGKRAAGLMNAGDYTNPDLSSKF